MPSDAQRILKCLSDWAAGARKGEIDDCYVFGSLTYQDGATFSHHDYDSDVDLVVKLRSDELDPFARSEVLRAFRADKLELEQELTKVMGVDDVSEPLVSALVVTPFELASDIHKTSSAYFFSTNAFMNLRTSEVASFPKSIDYGDPTKARFLVGAIQTCQEFRNKYLAFSSNDKSALSDHGGSDVIPKKLARSAAGVSHHVRPREGVNEFDVNEGTTFIFELVDSAAGTKAGPWQTLRQKLQQRQGRGNAVLSVADQILLHELLFERASLELKRLTGNGPVDPSPLSVLPVAQVNFVRGTQGNTVKNGQFRFSLQLNVVNPNIQLVLLGIEAHYVGPDGCYCLNGEPQIKVNGEIAVTTGNDFEFTGPISVLSGLAQISYSRELRPPLMIQIPADCDYGDVHVRIKVLIDGTVHTIERFFRFEVGGDLTPIVSLREPPILPDTLLSKLHGKGIITSKEFEKAGGIRATMRYQIVRFGDYIKHALSPTGEDIPVTEELRDFLAALHERALRAEEDI